VEDYCCPWSYTTTHTRQDCPGRGISLSQTHLFVNTQHSRKKNICVPGGIRSRKSIKRTAADPRLRMRCQRDRPKRLVNWKSRLWKVWPVECHCFLHLPDATEKKVQKL